jgi:5'-3' exonuclease
MGIQGLLIGLKPYTINGNILDYAGGTVAVDTSSWLHKSIYSIADHYVECQEQNRIDQRCIDVAARYMTQRCRELHDGFRVGAILLVLDGKRSPLKAGTNQDRDDRRAEHLRLARQYTHQKRPDAAFEKYKSCIKIVDALTIPVVQLVAQRLNYVQLIWSPYEADSQLAQLCMDGRAAVCITEDSDVLVYSAAAQVPFPIIYKLDRQSGNCDVISMDWLFNPIPPARQSKDPNVSQLEVIFDKLRLRQQQNPGWGARLFVMGCVLAGCDYAPRQILGVGLVKAFKLVKDAGITGSDKNLAKIFRYILQTALSTKSRGSVKDGAALEEQLARSEAVFYYHPVQRHDGRIVHFTSHETIGSPNLDRFTDCSFLGSLVANQHDDHHRGGGIIPAKALAVAATATKSPKKKKQAATTAKSNTKNPINNYFIAKEEQIKKKVATTPPSKRRALAAKRPPDSATSSLSSPSVVDDDDYKKYAQQENVQNYVTVAKKKKTTTNNPAINPHAKQGPAEPRHNKALASYRSHHDEPETMQRTVQIPWIRHQRDDNVDVRGVKRKFPKDGTRTIHPQQKVVVAATTSYTTAARQPPPPPPVIDDRFERAFARPSLLNNQTVSSPSLLSPQHQSAKKRSRFFYDELRPTDEPVAEALLSCRDIDHQQNESDPMPPAPTDHHVGQARFVGGPDRNEKVRTSHHRQPLEYKIEQNEHSPTIPVVTNEGLFQSPFFGNNATVRETAFQGYTDEPVQPNPDMDSANLFAAPPPSPNPLLDPTQDDEDDDEEHYGGPIGSSRWPDAHESRRVTMANVQPKENPIVEPSFDFYRQDCSPVARRPPTSDREVVDLLGDESENDDLDVLNVSPMVPMPPEAEVDYGIREPEPPPPRERSTIGPAKTHRNRYRTSDSHAQGRRTLSYVQSFLAKNRKRRLKQDSHNDAGPSCSSSAKKQKQTSILSHFKLG